MSQTSESPPWLLLDSPFDGPEDLEEPEGRFTTLLRRAAELAPPSRAVWVVRAQDRPWWEPKLRAAGAHVICQPFDRGSAVAVLMGALYIEEHEPGAWVRVLGRTETGASVTELLGRFQKRAPDMLASTQQLRSGRSLEELYPFLPALDADAVFGVRVA